MALAMTTPFRMSPSAAASSHELPPLATTLPSISPLNSTTRLSHNSHSSSHSLTRSPSYVHSDSHVPPLVRGLPRSCRLLGCANFAKIHGLCAAHFHADSDASATATTALPSPTRLPPLRFDQPRAVERPAIVHQAPHYIYATAPASASPLSHVGHQYHHYNHAHSHDHSYDHHAHALPSLSLPAPSRRYSEPVAYLAAPILRPSPSSERTQRFRRQSVDTFHYAPASTSPYPEPSPTNSAASSSSASAPKALCRRDNCRNAARRKGLCMEHGGRHFCKMDGCQKCAHRGGYCIAHGGGRRCGVDSCTKSAQSGGVCYSHGGGKRCATSGCSHAARSGGFCIKHGKMLKQQRDGDDANASEEEDGERTSGAEE